MTQKEKIEKNLYVIFEKLFFLKKSQKVFIKICDYNKVVLVFDIKNQHFYFLQDMIPHSQDENNRNVKYTVDKDDLVYIYRMGDKKLYLPLDIEIKAFRYSNDKLMDTGIKHIYKKDKRYVAYHICIV